MPTTATMTFRRTDYSGRGCLEYSWVPEGKRRIIILEPGQAQHTQIDTVPDNLKISQVQVYVLNNGELSTATWQFPPGPPYAHPVATASVSVMAKEAVGSVQYTDGTKAEDTRHLDAYPRQCPTGL
jgi:hypothetical protein